MLRYGTAIIAAAALMVQPAAAVGLGGTLTVSETGEKADGDDGRGFVETVVDQMKFSISAIIGQVGEKKSDKYHYSYAKEECEAAKEPTDEDSEALEAKEEEPVGPEPLYFGF